MKSEEELKALAAQLKKPVGEMGREVADMMHETNFNMTRHAINCMNVDKGQTVLELGHGSGKHIPFLIQQVDAIQYYGLEISDLMFQAASEENKNLIDSGQVHFAKYKGQEMPFDDAFFDRIFTVNTIYFWSDPISAMHELYRVMKESGMLCITYAQAMFMQQLPFAQYGFEFYDNKKIEALAQKTDFHLSGLINCKEHVRSKSGEDVERTFTTAVLTK